MARGESLYRQWQLLRTLQAHRFGVGLEELAERLECTTRTIQRDLNALQTCGFPVSFEERDSGKRYWKLESGFIQSDRLSLSMTEVVSLFLSRQMLKPLTGTHLGDGLESVLQKIGTLLPRSALGHFEDLGEAILVKNVVSQDYSGQDREIAALNEAILHQRVVKVVYASASRNRDMPMRLHPYGMVLLGGVLYCIGRVDDHEDVRTLKVSRIKGIERTSQSFQRPANFSLEAYTHGSFGIFASDEFETVEAEFTGWAATEVREQHWHKSQRIIKDAGDCVIAQFELGSTIEFRRWLLGFGSQALVRKPACLAAEVLQELQKAASEYRKAGYPRPGTRAR